MISAPTTTAAESVASPAVLSSARAVQKRAAVPPLFMWAGGKRKMLPHYSPLLPGVGSATAYVEPFAGGAALLAVMRTREPSLPVILGDRNTEIMGVYAAVRDRADALLAAVRSYEAAWASRSVAQRKAYYYDLRRRYWNMPAVDTLDAVAALLFLMRTGFNGIWQTCKDAGGRYGTPVGLATHKGAVVDPDTVKIWENLLRGATLHAEDYDGIHVPIGSFVFCDPPYRDSFTQYGHAFTDTDQEQLVEWCRVTATRTRSLVWLSNRLTTDDDGFFTRAAPDAHITTFPAIYTAGRRRRTVQGYKAKKANEILLMWDGRQKPRCPPPLAGRQTAC